MTRRTTPAHNPTPEILDTVRAIARRIAEARERQGITMTKLGEMVGTTRFTVAAAEQGRASTSLGVYVALIQALGLRIEVRSD